MALVKERDLTHISLENVLTTKRRRTQTEFYEDEAYWSLMMEDIPQCEYHAALYGSTDEDMSEESRPDTPESDHNYRPKQKKGAS